ncbi:hypothetical protein HWV07_16470 [Natronomonas salina]|uniref:hypothetical protein n=1 Tax=Natronomonas salina TaxID=1710540 RepID=UPI0015B72AFB|nr:hypothetical protein [Natronomonas salina]QLD90543.1 hypothetical protein HWV07_16470 [Natronomonas salina]
MSRTAGHTETVVDDGEVYVRTAEGRLRVGALADVVALVGGPAWEVTYTDRQRRRHPDLDTSDEGLVVDVVDVVNAMVLEEGFVDALATLPADPVGEADVAPRTGLFVGRLLGYLETGLG